MRTYATMDELGMNYWFINEEKSIKLDVMSEGQRLGIVEKSYLDKIKNEPEDSKMECIESFKDFIKALPDELKDIARDVLK
jgi:hypothetical protein